MKRLLLLSVLAFALSNCDTTPRDASTLEKLHGNWYGVEITNYLINQGVWDSPSSSSHNNDDSYP